MQGSEILSYLQGSNFLTNSFMVACKRHETLESERKGLDYLEQRKQHEFHVCISFSCSLCPSPTGVTQWPRHVLCSQFVCITIEEF